MKGSALGKAAVVVLLLVAIVAVERMKRAPAPVPAHAIAVDIVPGHPAASTRLPRLLDLGSTSCVPCKMMAPVLDELKASYRGRLQVDFIDVWKDAKAGEKYGIEAIPTQVIFDVGGKELYRHTGFWSREEITAKLKELKLVR